MRDCRAFAAAARGNDDTMDTPGPGARTRQPGPLPVTEGGAGNHGGAAAGSGFPTTPPDNGPTPAMVGEMHHHKGKTGRRRRKRRRSTKNVEPAQALRNAESADKPATPTAATSANAPERQGPAATPVGRKNRKRRRKRKDATASQALAERPLAAERPGGVPQQAASACLRGDKKAAIQGEIRQAGQSGAGEAPATRRAQLALSPAYAALDLGTNNCRLLVAAPTRPGQFRVVDAFSRIVRLGEGLGASGALKKEAMERALEALRICRDKLETRPVRMRRLIATEACRAAANGAEFLARVSAETGLELEIIDRQTEARLAVSGCGSLVEHDTQAVVLFDIGGGSSEIALIDVSERRSGHLSDHIIAWTSLPVGVVTLAEAFGGREVSAADFDAMVAHVTEMLDAFAERHRIGAHTAGERFHLLGTSGTVTTLAGLHLGLARYDRRRVDGLWMQRSDVDAMMTQLCSWSFEERRANPCIGADRADLVLAGCAIFEAIRRVWPSERLRVADRGLREGLLIEMMTADGAWRRNSGRGSR